MLIKNISSPVPVNIFDVFLKNHRGNLYYFTE